MIVLSTTTALMLYLFFTLTLLLSLFAYQHFALRTKKIIVSEDELLCCEYCHFAYLADCSKQVTKCPQCHSFNKDNKHTRKK